MTTRPGSVYRGFKVDLRPVSANDLVTLFQWRDDMQSFTVFMAPRVPNYADFAQAMQDTLRRTVTLLAVDPESARPIGLLQAYDVNLADGWCYFAAYFVVDKRGKWVGREAAVAFIDHLFRQFGFRKVYMELAVFNRAWLDRTILMDGSAFIEEGYFRQHVLHGDDWEDVQLLALYRERWSDYGSFLRQLFHDMSPLSDSATQPLRDPQRKGLARRRTPDATPTALALQFLDHWANNRLDDMLVMLESDVVLISSMTGTVAGFGAVEKVLRNRHRLLNAANALRPSSIQWSDPEEQMQSVIMRGCDAKGGQIELEGSFGNDGKLSGIRMAGTPDLMAKFYLGDVPRG